LKELTMAMHFGKRDPEPTKPLGSGLNVQRYGATASSPMATQPLGHAAASVVDENAPVTNTTTSASATPEGGSKLTVGPNIKLKGVEITDCDTLVVEGFVEATMDSRVIQIASQGAFKGSAEIDIAEIRGLFEGSLTVRQKLVIYASGKVTGKIRYGKVVIEEGGQLSGDIECTTASLGASTGAAVRTTSANKPAMSLAA
jgi:cytoskeletal protein CcmA (bactofilin family)